MRKNSALTIILLFAVLLGMAGCASGNTAQPNVETPQIVQYAYTSEFKTLLNNSKTYMNPIIYTDDGFYATAYEKLGEKIPEGAVAEYEDQYAIWGTKLYFIGFDGTKQELMEYIPLALQYNGEDKRDYQVYSDMNCVTMADGKLVTIENLSETWYDGPEDINKSNERYYDYVVNSSSYYIRTLDESGRELSCAKIAIADGYISPYSLVIDSKGNAIFPGESCLHVVDMNGKSIKKIELDYYADKVFTLADGSVALTAGAEGGNKLALLDTDTYTCGELTELPKNAHSPVGGKGEYYLYYNDGSNMYGLKKGESEPIKLFNWLNCDINAGNINSFCVNEDGSFTTILNRYISLDECYEVEYARISNVPVSSLPKKDVLTLATMGISWNMRDFIIDFNRTSTDCRVEIEDYSQYNTEENKYFGLTKLTTELLAGKVPDILDLSNLPYNQLASKDILEDLYPYLKADENLSKEKFFDNVFKALEVKGKLCSTCSNFSITTLAGAAAVVGDEPGWTYEDYYTALAGMPEGCEGLDVSVTRYNVLDTCLALDLNSYMDWTSGKCSFNSEEFKKLLEFSSTFPESFDWVNFDWSVMSNFDTRIAEGLQMLMPMGVYSLSDIRYYEYYFGGDATFIGYPTVTGTGNMISPGTCYAMCSAGEHKDQAWQFLRRFFTAEYQLDGWGLPTNRAAFDKLAKEEMTPKYKKNEDGNYILDKEGKKIEESRGSFSASDGKIYQFYAMTQNQLDELLTLIETTDKIYERNEKIYAIVVKHAQAYYAGDKSLDETVKLIQSEANIFINEQR